MGLLDGFGGRPTISEKTHRVLAVATDEIAQADLQTQQPNAFQQALAANARTDLDPVGDVSLSLYVEILRDAAARGYDESRSAGAAKARGVSADTWADARDEWTQRLCRNVDVATAIYDGLTARSDPA